MFPADAEVQAAGMATLVSVSSRSIPCIQAMVAGGAHVLVANALYRFLSNSDVAVKCISVAANMSNIPELCPVLSKLGLKIMAQQLMEKQYVNGDDSTRKLAEYLILNLEADGN